MEGIPEGIKKRSTTAPNYRSDVYALGVLLYKLFTGIMPSQGKTDWEILVNTCRGVRPESPHKVVPSRKIPQSISAIILRTLSPDPKDRHKDAAEVWAELGSYRAWELHEELLTLNLERKQDGVDWIEDRHADRR